MAIIAASWHIAVSSAPEHPLVCSKKTRRPKVVEWRLRFCEREGDVNVQGRQVHRDREQGRRPCCVYECGEYQRGQRNLAVPHIKCDQAFRDASTPGPYAEHFQIRKGGRAPSNGDKAAQLTSTSGRFVAPMTVTPTNSSTPSISFSKVSRTPSCVPLSTAECEREDARASISSCALVYIYI
jgi:hypothetical protein